VGICVRCRTALCGECITKLDGVNHCRACLEQLARRSKAPLAARSGNLSASIAITFGLSILSALTWFTLQMLMPGSSP
jgi:hypothetical protein